jgi:hypothetical protein
VRENYKHARVGAGARVREGALEPGVSATVPHSSGTVPAQFRTVPAQFRHNSTIGVSFVSLFDVKMGPPGVDFWHRGELMSIGEIQRIAICFFRNASCEKYRNSADFGVVCVVFGVKMGPGVDFLHRKRGEMVIIHR